MEILVAILLGTVVVLLVVKFLTANEDETIRELYGCYMMVEVNELDTNEDRREYLTDPEHRGMTQRCACDLYALPFPATKIKDNDVLHARSLCQPAREVIG